MAFKSTKKETSAIHDRMNKHRKNGDDKFFFNNQIQPTSLHHQTFFDPFSNKIKFRNSNPFYITPTLPH